MLSAMTTTRRLTVVWMMLLALTFGSFVVGIEQGDSFTSAAAVILIGVALFKVRLIGLHFMDLRVAPPALRWIYEAYVLVVFIALTVIDLVVVP